mgnify:CR=1 FL=1
MNKRPEFVRACRSVATAIADGTLDPDTMRLFCEDKPCCSLGHILHQTGVKAEPRIETQTVSFIREFLEADERWVDLGPTGRGMSVGYALHEVMLENDGDNRARDPQRLAYRIEDLAKVVENLS